MALSLVPIISHAYDFSAVNDDGFLLYYDIISEKDKTCCITTNVDEPWDYTHYEEIIGTLVIPPTANGYIVTGISDYAFCWCDGLTSVIIPNSVKWIDYRAFSACHNLTSVKLGNSLTRLGEGVFRYSNNITEIIVDKDNPKYNSGNNSNSIIETNTGKLIVGCKNTTIPESVSIIGMDAFGWLDITSITIPNSITTIEQNAFNGCQYLSTITLGNSVNDIAESAFSNCRISNVIFNTKTIRNWSFGIVPIETIKIGKAVQSIESGAFNGYSGLSTIYSEITEAYDIDERVFSGKENATLYVPKGTAATYRARRGWNVIKNIKEMEPFILSCNTKGTVSINGINTISNTISQTAINEGTDNTFTFTPKPGCRLDQVVLNGLDITSNVEGNTLTCTIPANSQMIVTFTTEQGDFNNDGTISISDVVAIVNKILGIQ